MNEAFHVWAEKERERESLKSMVKHYYPQERNEKSHLFAAQK